MAGPILFVTYGGGHVNALIPVIERLRRTRPDVGFHVLGLTTAAAKLAAAGIPSLGFKDFIEPGDEAALALGRELARDLPQGPVSADESVAYLGISFQELIEDLGEAAAREKFATAGRAAFLPVRFLERVIRRLQPRLVVATSSPRAERASILAARKAAVPALCLGDLFLGYEIEWLKDPAYADRVLVLNEFVRQRLIKAGRAADQVVVTGNPAFDALADPVWVERAAALRAARGWRDQQVVLWIAHAIPWDPPLREQICDALIDAAQRRPHWQLVLRTHPNEPLIERTLPDRVSLSDPRAEPPAQILRAVDAGVTMLSTMGFEALLLGVPMVSTAIPSAHEPTYLDLSYENYLMSMGLGIVAHTLDEIGPAVDLALRTRPDHRDRLPPLGQAASAVLTEIERLLPGA